MRIGGVWQYGGHYHPRQEWKKQELGYTGLEKIKEERKWKQGI